MFKNIYIQNIIVLTVCIVFKIANKSDSGLKNGVNNIVLKTHINTRIIRKTLNGKFSINALTRILSGFFSENTKNVLF